VEATTRPGVRQLMRAAGPGNPGNPQRAQPGQARRGRAAARMPRAWPHSRSHPTSVCWPAPVRRVILGP